MSGESIDEEINIPMSARRTESLDAAGIQELITKETNTLFGRVHVSHIIEKANLGVTLVDHSNTITGHAAFYDHPNWTNNSETFNWVDWLNSNFINADKCDPINTLFLHYFVAKEEFSEGITKEIVRTVFHAVPFLQFIILVVPTNIELDASLSKVFQSLQKVKNSSVDSNVFACYRHNHCPVLHIREARIEDHDDLMPIFDKNNSHLTEIYGDFFLAELIEAQDEGNKCIVADVDGTAVGFVSISSDINTDILKDNFELGVFNYFLKKIKRKREVTKEAPKQLPNERDQESDTKSGRESLTPTNLEANTPSGQKRSPLRSAKRRTPKLSSTHLDNNMSHVNVPKSPEVEYITEVFDVESVFCIQLFCIDDKYEARSIDFLQAMFDLFPDKDFVVITVPHNVPEFPLLQLFQRVTPRHDSTLGHELYLFNRYGLYKSFKVRPCKLSDETTIRKLTESIVGHKDIMRDVKQYNEYRSDKDGTRIHAFVAEVIGQVVGVCIFRDELDIEYIRSHYNIEDFVYFCLHETTEHGHLHHFVLNPIFQHYSKYFIKESLSLSRKSSLYYPVYPSNENTKEKPHSLVTCLTDLVPVSVRRQIVYPMEELGQNAPVENIVKEMDPYALYHINRKLTLEPKVVINLRIVVVGASTVGLSAIESFVYCPHLRFNNLTLVSEENIFNTTVSTDLCNDFMPKDMDYNSRKLKLLALPTFLNFIKGKMTRIDRKNKVMIIDGNQQVPYDQLLLCTGQQFYYTVPTGADVEDLITTSEALMVKLPQVHLGHTPNNVFVLNSPADCEIVKKWIENSFDSDTVIVYGSTLESYICIHGLIKHGVKGSSICHVHPPQVSPSCFNLPYVDKIMKKEIEKLGIRSYHGYTLARWNNGLEDGDLRIASFTSDAKPLSLPCQAFICCHKKTVNYDAFKAMNDSCLVYDGKLVIDAKFETNDECIRAAGPLTKYARRYHSENWTHANFNSKEIGIKLAETVLELFDPTLEIMEQSQSDRLIPRYKDAIVEYCCLPGGHNYFHVFKPCIRTPLETQQAQSDYGEDLVTGDSIVRDVDKGYFRLHINQYKSVQDITCLSKKMVPVTNLLCLYGMHVRYLNNIVQRYKEGLIEDFYKYFQETWCLAIFHDRFKDFRSEVREILSTPDEAGNISLEDRIRKMALEDSKLRQDQMKHLNDIFISTNCKSTIQERLNCFLDYNKYHLPMFARPGML